MCDEKYCNCNVSDDGQDITMKTDYNYYCDTCELKINREWTNE